MSDTTCPHCGGPIVTYSPICEYCGSAISDTPMIWQRIDHKLPPVDPQNSGRSIPVITVNLSDGISFKDKRNGNIVNWYDFIEPLLISAYYNFTTKIWSNDLLGKRSGEIKATHWMHIPPIGSSAWISTADRLPYSGSEHSSGDRVLVCDKSKNFELSVVSADLASKTKVWWCTSLVEDNPEDPLDAYVVSVTHWIPLPRGPVE